MHLRGTTLADAVVSIGSCCLGEAMRLSISYSLGLGWDWCPVNYSAVRKPDPSGPQASGQQLPSRTPWDKVMLGDLDKRKACVGLDLPYDRQAHQQGDSHFGGNGHVPQTN